MLSPVSDAGQPGPPPASRPVLPERRPPLPERRPQEHLAAELRDSALTDAEPGESTGPVRSPEETRERFTRYQRAWRAGGSADSHEDTDQDRTRQDS